VAFPVVALEEISCGFLVFCATGRRNPLRFSGVLAPLEEEICGGVLVALEEETCCGFLVFWCHRKKKFVMVFWCVLVPLEEEICCGLIGVLVPLEEEEEAIHCYKTMKFWVGRHLRVTIHVYTFLCSTSKSRRVYVHT
jgi:hypothetical protein